MFATAGSTEQLIVVLHTHTHTHAQTHTRTNTHTHTHKRKKFPFRLLCLIVHFSVTYSRAVGHHGRRNQRSPLLRSQSYHGRFPLLSQAHITLKLCMFCLLPGVCLSNSCCLSGSFTFIFLSSSPEVTRV